RRRARAAEPSRGNQGRPVSRRDFFRENLRERPANLPGVFFFCRGLDPYDPLFVLNGPCFRRLLEGAGLIYRGAPGLSRARPFEKKGRWEEGFKPSCKKKINCSNSSGLALGGRAEAGNQGAADKLGEGGLRHPRH